MEQVALFHEDEIDALRDCIRALGGSKEVGSRLWPDKPPDKAGEHLSNALNPGHQQKLSFSEGLTIMRWSREIGCHVAMAYVTDTCNYHRTEPREPDDHMAELQRDFIAAVEKLEGIKSQMKRVAGPTTRPTGGGV